MASSSRATKEAEGESSTNYPNWLELPRDLTSKIFQKLDDVKILTIASPVCSLWWNICKDPLMWRTIDLTNLCYKLYYMDKISHSMDMDKVYDRKRICLAAVERNCGHLEDITIDYYCLNELLKYIADSTSRLRCLRLPHCWGILDIVVREVVMKLPLLEELDVSSTRLSKDSLETIGQCCPLLKVLKFMKEASYCFLWGFGVNDMVFVIAKFMPELRHLEIIGNRLDNDGLLAILDGCPHLEYLVQNEHVTRNLPVRLSVAHKCWNARKGSAMTDS